jgi:hypothetical protein
MFNEANVSNAIAMLGFGIVYLAIGILLFKNKRFSRILGFIFPLIGLLLGFDVIGLKNWDAMLTIMFIIDAVVVLCCLILLLNRIKVKNES